MVKVLATNNVGTAATFHPFIEPMTRRGSGALVGIGMKMTGALREGRYVPFGPFLAGAGIVVMLIGVPRALDFLGW